MPCSRRSARFYVNDFNVFGRTWQVNIQGETPFRDNIDDVYRIYVRNAQGGMVPIRAVAEAKLVQGPQTVIRYNGYRGAIVNGAPKPGYSSGQALAAMERISASTLPAGYSYRMDRHGAAGKGGERTHRDRARVWPSCSLICFSSHSTRAGIFRCPRSCRSASRCSAPSSRW